MGACCWWRRLCSAKSSSTSATVVWKRRAKQSLMVRTWNVANSLPMLQKQKMAMPSSLCRVAKGLARKRVSGKVSTWPCVLIDSMGRHGDSGNVAAAKTLSSPVLILYELGHSVSSMYGNELEIGCGTTVGLTRDGATVGSVVGSGWSTC